MLAVYCNYTQRRKEKFGKDTDFFNNSVFHFPARIGFSRLTINSVNLIKFGQCRFHSNLSAVSGVQNKLALSKSAIASPYVYRSDTFIFNKLVLFLTNYPLNEENQIRIEKFLVDQGLELAQSQINSLNSKSTNISNSIVKLLFDNKIYLEQLINSYKLNLSLDSDSGDNLFKRIFLSSDLQYLITIILGRVLTIVSRHHQIADDTTLTQITIGLGKDIIKN